MTRRQADPFDPVQIGRRLRALRFVLGHTQVAMARAVGATGPNPAGLWNNYESGSRRINVDAAAALCRSYSVTMDWIYFGDSTNLTPVLRDKLETELAHPRPPRSRLAR